MPAAAAGQLVLVVDDNNFSRRVIVALLRSAAIGCWMGITPGGPTAASFMSYGIAKRVSPRRANGQQHDRADAGGDAAQTARDATSG